MAAAFSFLSSRALKASAFVVMTDQWWDFIKKLGRRMSCGFQQLG
jgi:hypothetical protein